MKRTTVDFSNHNHRVELYDCGDKQIRIDHFQVGDSRRAYIQFINTSEVLTVTGDYGNWVFCRPFIPKAGNSVNDSYWIEKLRIASEQNLRDIDLEATSKAIKELLNGGLEDYGYEGEKLKQAKEWFNELLDNCEDELTYLSFAYRDYEKPYFIDYEEIPCIYKVPIWLEIIFDAYEEVCNRLKTE